MVMTLIRAVVLYAVVIFSLRVMGKRQIGELQPGELVVTIIISECAAAPIQDLDRPVISGIISILVLVILEILLSLLTLKFPLLHRALDGTPAIVVRDGKPVQHALKNLRLTIEDLVNSLRQMGYFKLEEIAYCIVETDGRLSVLPKAENLPATAGMVGAVPPDGGLPCVLIADGKIHPTALSLCGMNEAALQAILQKEQVRAADVFMLTAEDAAHYTLIKKEAAT